MYFSHVATMKKLCSGNAAATLCAVLCALFACVCLGACSNSENPTESVLPIDDPDHPGMMRMAAAGNPVYLGTDNPLAKSSERPQMKSVFDYDFSIGMHEVTRGEYYGKVDSANFPVVNVTYFDAVLFANSRSKSEKLDTAYTYRFAVFDEFGTCLSLEGLVFHPEVDAYRLPTEAEWIYAAFANWNPDAGWHNGNSGYAAHEVCTAGNGVPPCDMAGNVMEWVNDWLGRFSDIEVRNFVGAPDGGSLGERVLKGGSFRNDVSSINFFSRGDVYTVASSMKSDYVGFRLAFGKIPGATWMGSDGNAAQSVVTPLAGTSTVWEHTGSFRSKLAFRNDVTGNIAYVDYSKGMPSVVEIRDTLDAYHPDISPDGNRVAFCTGLEGVAGKSRLFVRSLNLEGSGLRELDVESAAIPRWRVLDSGDTVIVYVTSAANNKDESAFRSAETWQVKFSGGKFGTPEKLFDGAFHGGVSRDNRLAVSGARLLRAAVAKSSSPLTSEFADTVWYGGEQACNASLSSDSLKRTLFLDFGGRTGREFAGVEYGTHEMLLVADSVGSLVRAVPAPAGYSYDHSEWSHTRNPDLAVTTIANANGAHTKIAFMDVSDSSLVELAEGEELWHPCLWAQKEGRDDASVAADSAGAYYKAYGDATHDALRVKMELFWKHLDEIEYYGVGSSRLEDGFMPDSLTAGYALNVGFPGNALKISIYLAENYAFNHLPNLKAVVISLDFDLWQTDSSAFRTFYTQVGGFKYDADHGFWVDGIPYGFISAVEGAFPATEESQRGFSESRGYHAYSAGAWGTPDVEVDPDWVSKDPDVVERQLARLRSFLANAEARNVYVVGVVFPQNPAYRETVSWGRYGPLREVGAAMMDSVMRIAEEFPMFRVMDENLMGDHDYVDSDALNTDHLAFDGAVKFTKRLDSVLKKLQ